MITKGLLNAILDTEVKKVDLDKNTIIEQDIYDDKIGILDIKATLNNDMMCNIEMQMLNQANLDKRMMFYWSKLYTSSIKKGQKYASLKKTIIILIANFEMMELKNIPKGHTVWQLREKDFSEIALTDICEICIIELPKLIELMKDKPKNKLWQWTKFLLAPQELEVDDMENDEAIKKAIKEFEDINQDEHERYLAELRLKHLLDTEAVREAGVEEGKKEKQKEIAKKLLKREVDIEIIMESTELTREEIEDLKE